MTLSLGEVFPQEQARVRGIMRSCIEIGPSGAFLASICERILQRADRAAVSQDVPAMIAIYQEMRELKE
jgi:hypothetical protein